MKRSKTSDRHRTATGILRKTAKAIGSVVGMLAARTGIADEATNTQEALLPPVKKHTKKATAKKTPAMKRARVLKPLKS
jgi:hypothetical protein